MEDQLYIAGFTLIFGAAELLHPSGDWPSWTDRLRNTGYGVLVLGIGSFLSVLLYSALPITPRPVSLDGSGIILIYGLLYVAVFDFFFYWYHRMQHRFLPLWALHELHHADESVNATTGIRTYWLDYPVQTVAIAIPTYLILGVNGPALTVALIVSAFFLIWSHANLKIWLGPLTAVFVGPHLHRIHHSRDARHHNRNFAQILPIYDILFGTYYAPARNEFPKTGIGSQAGDAPLSEVLVKPFQIWRRILMRRKRPNTGAE